MVFWTHSWRDVLPLNQAPAGTRQGAAREHGGKMHDSPACVAQVLAHAAFDHLLDDVHDVVRKLPHTGVGARRTRGSRRRDAWPWEPSVPSHIS